MSGLLFQLETQSGVLSDIENVFSHPETRATSKYRFNQVPGIVPKVIEFTSGLKFNIEKTNIIDLSGIFYDFYFDANDINMENTKKKETYIIDTSYGHLWNRIATISGKLSVSSWQIMISGRTDKVNDIKQLIGYRGNETDISGLKKFEALINNSQFPECR